MATDPQAFFRFAADHYHLLVDLFYRGEGVNDVELLALIERHRSPASPSPHYVAEQLVKLGILEAAPEATAAYELTRQVRNLLGYLLMEHRLTSAAVLQGYLNDLDQLGRELDGAITAAAGNRAVRVLAEVGDILERIRRTPGPTGKASSARYCRADRTGSAAECGNALKRSTACGPATWNPCET